MLWKKMLLIQLVLWSGTMTANGERLLELNMTVPNGISDSLSAQGLLSVIHYGAIPDDGIDDTVAIQTAMNTAYEYDMVCYFPSGVYNISDRLVGVQKAYPMPWNPTNYNTTPSKAYVLRGEKGASGPAVLKLTDSSPGFTDVNTPKAMLFIYGINPAYPNDLSEANESPASCYGHSISDLDFDLGASNNGAIGISLHGAQNNGIYNVNINANDGFAGIKNMLGNGGFIANVQVTGGKYGFYVEASRHCAVMTGITLVNQADLSIYWTGMSPPSLIGFKIQKATGPALNLTTANYMNNNMNLVDGSIELTTGGTAIQNANNSIIMKNVYVKADTVISNTAVNTTLNGAGSAWLQIAEYATADILTYMVGNLIVDQQVQTVAQIDTVVNASGPENDMIERHLWDIASFPAFEDTDAVNAKTLGVIGDGIQDDTAALQNAINQYQKIFLPRGIYLISETLTLKPDTQLFGTAKNYSIIRQNTTWQPASQTYMIQTADSSEAKTILSNIHLETWYEGLYSQYMTALNWRAGKNSVLLDILLNVCGNKALAYDSKKRSVPIVVFSANAGGQVYGYSIHEGAWNNVDNYRHLLVTDTFNPLSFYALSIEHADTSPMMEIVRSANVFAAGLKLESSPSSPDMLNITDSQNISIVGQGGNASAAPGRALITMSGCENLALSNICRQVIAGPYPVDLGSFGIYYDPATWFTVSDTSGGSTYTIDGVKTATFYKRGEIDSKYKDFQDDIIIDEFNDATSTVLQNITSDFTIANGKLNCQTTTNAQPWYKEKIIAIRDFSLEYRIKVNQFTSANAWSAPRWRLRSQIDSVSYIEVYINQNGVLKSAEVINGITVNSYTQSLVGFNHFTDNTIRIDVRGTQLTVMVNGTTYVFILSRASAGNIFLVPQYTLFEIDYVRIFRTSSPSYVEDFNDGDTSRWTGPLSIANGVLNTEGIVLHNSGSYADFSLSVDIKTDVPSGWTVSRIPFRYQDFSNCCELIMTEGNKLYVRKRINGSAWSDVISNLDINAYLWELSGTGPSVKSWNKITLTVSGNDLTVKINDTLVAVATDIDLTGALATGQVGVRGFAAAGCMFDNFNVK